MAIRVLVVDDSAVMRNLLRTALGSDPAIDVVATASNAASAREAIRAFNPDVITLDINMPGMDGLTFLDALMRLRPSRVVMVSSLTLAGAAVTLRALEAGAVDFVTKPSMRGDGMDAFGAEIIAKVKTAATALVPWAAPGLPHDDLPRASGVPDKLVALGASTGGVSAIEYIVRALPADGPAICVALHMPPPFTRQFASRLDQFCAMQVVEAANGMQVRRGTVYVAPGDFHFTIDGPPARHVCRITGGAKVGGFKPSVDVLFNSVAENAGRRAVGVILTGMGRDGAAGLKAMRDAGARTACQDAATSLIYGMPAAAVAAAGVEMELPLNAIPGFILATAGAAGHAGGARD